MQATEQDQEKEMMRRRIYNNDTEMIVLKARLTAREDELRRLHQKLRNQSDEAAEEEEDGDGISAVKLAMANGSLHLELRDKLVEQKAAFEKLQKDVAEERAKNERECAMLRDQVIEMAKKIEVLKPKRNADLLHGGAKTVIQTRDQLKEMLRSHENFVINNPDGSTARTLPARLLLQEFFEEVLKSFDEKFEVYIRAYEESNEGASPNNPSCPTRVVAKRPRARVVVPRPKPRATTSTTINPSTTAAIIATATAATTDAVARALKDREEAYVEAEVVTPTTRKTRKPRAPAKRKNPSEEEKAPTTTKRVKQGPAVVANDQDQEGGMQNREEEEVFNS